MYPKNAASPQRIAVGAVVQISDGAVQTTGVSVKVMPQGGAASAGGGTVAYEEGIVHYVPTQAETNYASFVVIAYKTGCIPAAVTIVTTASGTAGYAGLDWSAITAATTTVNLSGTTIKTATDVEADTADLQSRTPAALVSGRMDVSVGAMANNTLTAAALAADAVTEIQAGLSTLDAAGVRTGVGLASANLDTQLSGINAKTTNLPSDPADASDIAAAFSVVNGTLSTLSAAVVPEVADILAIAVKLNTLLQAAGGSPGDYEFSADALRNAPAGGGDGGGGGSADWDATERAQIRYRLGIDGTASAPTAVPTLALQATVAGTRATTDKLETLLEPSGAGSPADYRFTDEALAKAADAVLNPQASGYGIGGSVGAAISAAASPTDPWTVALPGAYAPGTAGYIVGGVMLAWAERGLTLLQPAGGSPGEYQLSADALRSVISVVPTAIENADALLDRDMSAGVDSGSPTYRTPRQAFRILRNRWVISGSTQSIKKEDDSTESWSQTLGTTVGADPVTSTDPAG